MERLFLLLIGAYTITISVARFEHFISQLRCYEAVSFLSFIQISKLKLDGGGEAKECKGGESLHFVTLVFFSLFY